jgi:hypothetical protein
MGIIVLIVLIAIFGGQIGILGAAAKECPGDFYCPSFLANSNDDKPNIEEAQAQMELIQAGSAQGCSEGFTSLGIRIRPGQPPGDVRNPKKVQYCVPCCAPAGG